MKNKVLIFIIIVLITICIILGICLKTKFNNEENMVVSDNSNITEEEHSEDAIKFKRDYESLNGTIRESDGATYGDITISEDNPIVYVSIEEALNIIKNGNGFIYVGSNSCPWCRINTPVMLEVAKNLNIDTIYYLTLNEQNPSKENLRELQTTLYNDVNNNEKEEKIRISMPYYGVIKNGEVTYTKSVAIKLNEGQTKYDELTTEQHDELYNIFYEIFTQ